jgi:lipopolysaccharide assembly outer membrane protein LptD (OstA)
MVQSLLTFSQERNILIDSISVKKDSVVIDSVYRKQHGISKDAVDLPIIHNAKGYRRTDMINKKVYLVGEADVKYGDITLKADSIVLDMETSEVFAIGRVDSTGKVKGSPEFSQGEAQYKSKELRYNFKSKKGILKNIFTEQDQGFLHSTVTKREDDGTLNISKSTYSTCDLEKPHFSLNFNKAKVFPGKKIVSGPAYLVLEDIPLPLIVPFGYFPVQKNRSSGLILPTYGESQQLGYSLSNGGYYLVFNDYLDLTTTGTLYTNGSWLLNLSSNYKRLYKYNGNLSFNYASNISGHKGLPDYSKSTNYRIGWTFNQDEKARPGSRFSASVNMSSSGYDRNNSYTVSDHVNSQRQSSVSYTKTWAGTPFNLSASLNHSQNVKNKTISLNLPKVNFNVSRIYPLKSRNSTGPSKWYQELTFSYTASLDNQIDTRDSLLFTSAVWKNMKNGFSHQLPVSFQLRPFKNFSISPQVMYSGVLYSQKIEKRWVSDYINQDNKVAPTVVNDTIRGAFYGQSVNPSISASYSPQLFGTYQFREPKGRLQAVRHIIRPSVSFSYVPVIKSLTTDMYRKVQSDTLGTMSEYSIFESNIFGTPSKSTRSGGFSFSLVNILEGKRFEKNDTTGKPKKFKIIDNFSINTAYNIFADSMRWAPLSVDFRTVLFKNLNIAATSNFSIYGLDSKGNQVKELYYNQTKKYLRMTNLSASLDFDLGQLFKKKENKTAVGATDQEPDRGYGMSSGKTSDIKKTVTASSLPLDKYGYAQFDVPWNLRLAYNFNLTKTGLNSLISQTLAISGDLAITKKTRITYTTGLDIVKKQITMSSVGIVRDLHCWEMSIDWIPTGYLKSWNFTIKVKASVLGDLKYTRRKDFRDQY